MPHVTVGASGETLARKSSTWRFCPGSILDMSPEESPAAAAPPVIGRAGSYSKGVARRQEILERAIEVFRDRGADGTSLRRIATAIGVSHAALLHYFDSREQLLVAVYEYAESKRDTAKMYGDSISALEVLVTAADDQRRRPGDGGALHDAGRLVAGDGRLPAERVLQRALRPHPRGSHRAPPEPSRPKERIRDDVDASDMAALIIAASDGLQIQWLLEPSIELERTLETFAVLFAPVRLEAAPQVRARRRAGAACNRPAGRR